MSAGWIVALELIAVLGGVIGWAAWDLLCLRRERLHDRDRGDPPTPRR